MNHDKDDTEIGEIDLQMYEGYLKSDEVQALEEAYKNNDKKDK
jgi:hypothetical protein